MTTITNKNTRSSSVADIIAMAAETFKSGKFVENRALAGMTVEPVQKKEEIDEEYEAWKHEMGLDQPLTEEQARAHYCSVFNIYE